MDANGLTNQVSGAGSGGQWEACEEGLRYQYKSNNFTIGKHLLYCHEYINCAKGYTSQWAYWWPTYLPRACPWARPTDYAAFNDVFLRSMQYHGQHHASDVSWSLTLRGQEWCALCSNLFRLGMITERGYKDAVLYHGPLMGETEFKKAFFTMETGKFDLEGMLKSGGCLN